MGAQPGSNGFNKEELGDFLSRIADADDELLTLAGEHREKCKDPHGRIKEVMVEAKEAGLNMASFRAVVASHRAERRLAKRLSELETDDLQDFKEMQEALGDFGDTPLGTAALNRARLKIVPAGDTTLDSLTQ